MLHVKRNLRIDCPNECNCVRAFSDDCVRCRRNKLHKLDYFDPYLPYNPYYYGYWYWTPVTNQWTCTSSNTMTSSEMHLDSTTVTALNAAFPDNYTAKT